MAPTNQLFVQRSVIIFIGPGGGIQDLPTESYLQPFFILVLKQGLPALLGCPGWALTWDPLCLSLPECWDLSYTRLTSLFAKASEHLKS